MLPSTTAAKADAWVVSMPLSQTSGPASRMYLADASSPKNGEQDRGLQASVSYGRVRPFSVTQKRVKGFYTRPYVQ